MGCDHHFQSAHLNQVILGRIIPLKQIDHIHHPLQLLSSGRCPLPLRQSPTTPHPVASWSLHAQQTGDAPRRDHGACTFNSVLVSANIPSSMRDSQILKWKKHLPCTHPSLSHFPDPAVFVSLGVSSPAFLHPYLLSHLSRSLAQKHVHFLRARTCPPRYLMYPNACSNAQVAQNKHKPH